MTGRNDRVDDLEKRVALLERSTDSLLRSRRNLRVGLSCLWTLITIVFGWFVTSVFGPWILDLLGRG